MTRSPAASIVLMVLLSGCADTPNPPPSGSSVGPSLAASAAPAGSALPSAEPDWSALPSLQDALIATAPLTAAWPTAFASATEDGIWLPNGDEGDGPPAVARLDPETMDLTATIDIGGEENASPPDAWATAPSADGVWVALASRHEVVLIDPATNAVSRRLEVDGVPYSVADDGDGLWIADFERSTVLRVDRANGEELLRVDGIRDPIEIAVGEEGVWVTEHRSGNLVRLDPESGDVLATIPVGGRPGVAIGLGSVWARSDDDRTLSHVDPATNRLVATIPMPGNPVDFVIAGESLWVVTTPQRGECDRNSHVVRIDLESNEPDGFLQLPCAFGIATDGQRVWVGFIDGDDQIIEIDTAR